MVLIRLLKYSRIKIDSFCLVLQRMQTMKLFNIWIYMLVQNNILHAAHACVGAGIKVQGLKMCLEDRLRAQPSVCGTSGCTSFTN